MIEKLVIGLQRFFFGHRLLTLGVLLAFTALMGVFAA